jgi:hypothetical protein
MIQIRPDQTVYQALDTSNQLKAAFTSYVGILKSSNSVKANYSLSASGAEALTQLLLWAKNSLANTTGDTERSSIVSYCTDYLNKLSVSKITSNGTINGNVSCEGLNTGDTITIDENSDVSQETIDQNKISGKALYSFTVTSSASSQSGYEITVNTGEKLAEGTHKVIDEDGKVTTCETTNGIISFTSGRLGKFVVYDENETSAVPGYMIAIASIEGVIILSLGVLILLKVYLPKKKPTAK